MRWDPHLVDTGQLPVGVRVGVEESSRSNSRLTSTRPTTLDGQMAQEVEQDLLRHMGVEEAKRAETMQQPQSMYSVTDREQLEYQHQQQQRRASDEARRARVARAVAHWDGVES